jgi:hypothetical protein
MGEIHVPARVLHILAASSRYVAALDWARGQGQSQFGPVAQISDAFAFTETAYYTSSMGPELKKQFLAFEQRIDPADLPAIKRQTNEWEAIYAAAGEHPESRPLNLDPGYITPAKLVLASTKDHAHRIYLREGIYAEITLSFRQQRWQPLEWTYPDYRRDDYQQFFTRCREWLLNCGTEPNAVK